MHVDLELLKRFGRTVVHCASEEHAKMFMEAMWKQYPELVEGIWRPGQTNWSELCEKNGGIYYLPRIVRNRTETYYCQSTNNETASGGNYIFVEFVDLLKDFDLGEFSNDGADIKSLFDIG